MEAQIQELYQPLFLFVRKRISNHQDAEDLTQDIFYKLAKSNPLEVKNISRWVYTIAKNTITDFYRKKKIYTEDIDDLNLGEEGKESDVVQELSRCIHFYVAQLPEDYREIMRMSELEGIAQKEIASRLNLNYATVRSKVQRGRDKLRDIFSDCCIISQGPKGSILDFTPRSNCEKQDKNCGQKPKDDC